jgi:hypothetical protein
LTSGGGNVFFAGSFDPVANCIQPPFPPVGHRLSDWLRFLAHRKVLDGHTRSRVALIGLEPDRGVEEIIQELP